MISTAYYRDAARCYLAELGLSHASGGYVHFYLGEACGWSASAHLAGHPRHFRPCVVAVPVDPFFPILVATGGNDEDGAERWEVRS